MCEFEEKRQHASGMLPLEFATSIKAVTCIGAVLEFHYPMPCLEELVIDVIIPSDRLPELIPILRASKGSLRKLHVIADIEVQGDVDQEPVTLEKLEDISLSLWNLVDNFSPAFIFPSLSRLSIADFDMAGMERDDWEHFFARGDPSTTIKYLSLPYIECGDVQDIIPFISMMQALDTLSIQGESVELIIQARMNVITAGTITDYDENDECSLRCFSTIKTLTIVSYTGTGEVVLQYIQAVQQAKASGYATGQSKLQEVTFDDCPNVTEAMGTFIRAHLDVR